MTPSHYVVHDESLMRPVDVPELRGDAHHVRAVLGWEPATLFTEMVEQMVQADALRVQLGREEGLCVLNLAN